MGIDWKKLEAIVKAELQGEKTGHDFKHTKRVLKHALRIAKHHKEADLEILKSACWLHDISCGKHGTKEHHLKSAEMAGQMLQKLGMKEAKIPKVKESIIDHCARFNPTGKKWAEFTIETRIHRDADEIDALGYIGLARMITYSASQGWPYFKSKNDKVDVSLYGNVKYLAKWPETMMTPEGKKIGKEKTKILLQFMKGLETEIKD